MRLAGLLAVLLLLAPSAAVAQTPAERAKTASELAWERQGQGDFEGALAAFREMLAISREIGDRSLEGNTINFIGLVHQFLGDYPAARVSYRRALQIARDTGDRKLEGVVLFQIGWLHFLRGDFEAALRSFELSLVSRRAAGDRKGEGLTLIKIGMTYNSLSRHEKALQYESEALPLVHAYADPQAEADVLDHMGVALTFLRRPEEAVERHTRALEIRRSQGDRWSYPFSLSRRARAFEALRRYPEAAADMREVVDIVETGRRRLSTRRFRASLFAGMAGHYEHTVNVLMESGDDLGALSVSERARARMTLDAVREALAHADSANGPSPFGREDSLRDEIDRKQRRLDTASAASSPPIATEIESLNKTLRSVEEEIGRRYPTLAEARNADALSPEQIRAEMLDGHTAVVEYFLGREKSFVWVLTSEGIKSYSLPPRAVIEAAAVKLHELLAGGDQRTKRHELEAALALLSAMIVKPVPKGVDRLIIVPDGALFYVPFAALGLIDRYEIAMAPSASALVLLRRGKLVRARTEDAVAVFADPVFRSDDPRVFGIRGQHSRLSLTDPDLLRSAEEMGLHELRRLPATRAEANAIASLVHGRARKALDFDASRETVLHEDLGRYRVVHFATHSLVNARHPDLSGIVLSLVDRRGAPVNGFLRVPDLYRLKGASDLVVLSACRTATGKALRGEGIVGLVSGFMNAGTPSIVASYWDVRDQPTAELMKRFYAAMFTSGLSPAAALRVAQQSMRAEQRWRSPVYWAAFALYGLP